MPIELSLFLVFFKIGAFTFGGGYAMLPLIEQEVLAHHWMSEGDIINFIAVSESTPGPFAVNMSTYVGARTAGFSGAVCATLGVVLPSFLIILLIAGAYKRFESNSAVKGVMGGLRPAVVGLIASACVTVAKSAFFYDTDFSSGIAAAVLNSKTAALAAVFALSCFLTFKKKLHPILIICIAGGTGILLGYLGVL